MLGKVHRSCRQSEQIQLALSYLISPYFAFDPIFLTFSSFAGVWSLLLFIVPPKRLNLQNC
ncbi:hypothetical protein SAMN05421740_10717 [Parapedobacter koreensis]|uniref:Uncharacterized protein n=1 Tax=Parapedobacter koreensis TaxID=332977 RepID=A0A1H7RE09_9SPHI|nr:hypothetical protein SAMN05421740_10717 [Parapedobacter koreensis]